MTSEIAEELFPEEYRHEVVVKFIKNLIDGRIRLPDISERKKGKQQELAVREYVELTNDITKYTSRKFDGESLDDIEHRIFTTIVVYRLANAIENNINENSLLQEEIVKIH
jgi:hypothetical protein